MKKQLIIIVSIVFIVLGILYIPGLFGERKLFTVMKVPDFAMTNQENETITNKTMLGKVYVVEFFFSTCPTICPVMNNNLTQVMNDINSDEFGIISITIDPKNDTADHLRFHKNKLGITSENWHFLTGDIEYIRNLSKEFNIYIDINDNENSQNLDHSGMLALVDKQGRVRSRYNEQGIPVLYYSGLNYEDEKGMKSSLTGEFKPDIISLQEDIIRLINEK